MLSQSQIRTYWAPRCTGPFATMSLYGAGRVTVDAAIVPAVKALNQILAKYGYATRRADTGAYNCRLNTSGTSWSMHAYAIALDLNWQSNPYYSTLRTDMFRYGDGRMPNRITAIRTNNGKQVWNWGGFWSGNKDAMHYEIVCTPADLRTGINWSTVYGGSVAPTPVPQPTPEPEPEEGPMYRIYYFKNSTGTIAAYRCLCAKAEKKTAGDPFIVVDAWHIENPDALRVWQERGLATMNKNTTPAPVRGSINYYNGPFDNTKTV